MTTYMKLKQNTEETQKIVKNNYNLTDLAFIPFFTPFFPPLKNEVNFNDPFKKNLGNRETFKT